MTRIITILFLMASLALAFGAKRVVFSVIPPVAFTLCYSTHADAPRTWKVLTNGIGSVAVSVTVLNTFTNEPEYYQRLALVRSSDTNVAGYTLYWGTQPNVYTNALHVTRGTNVTLTGLVPVMHYYELTCYGPDLVESPASATVAAMPAALAPPITVFFYALADAPTVLKSQLQ